MYIPTQFSRFKMSKLYFFFLYMLFGINDARSLSEDVPTDSKQLLRKIEELNNVIGQLNATVMQLKSKNDVVVNHTYGFYAYATQRQNLYNQQTIIFDYVETNVGNCFDVSTGKFRAPVRGLFFFAGNIMAAPGHYIHVEMVKNGRRVSSIFAAKGEYPYDDNTGSAAVNLVLQKGDEVWLRDQNDPDGEAIVTDPYAMFSGFLISENI